MTPVMPTDASRQSTRWLAAIGVALLAVAAISLAAARWDRFGPGSRLTILVAASAVVFAVTQALRQVAPDTTRALNVLVATLIPVDVATLVIVSGGTWRPALVAAGPAAVISSETLRRSDRSFVTELGTAAGGVVTMCGLAAVYGVSASVLVSGLGLLAVLMTRGGGDRWFGVTWALLGGLTPALRVLDDAVFTGMGTLRDLGLLDAAEPWQTVTSGALATAALVLAAVGWHRPVVALGAIGTAAATGLQIWGEFDPPATVGLIAAAVALVMVELALVLPAVRRSEQVSLLVAEVTAVCAGMLTIVVAAIAWVGLTGGEMPGAHFQYTAAVLALFWLVGDLRRAAVVGTLGLDIALDGGRWHPALPGFVASTAAAVYLGTGQASMLGGVLAALAVGAVATRRPARLATAGLAFAAAPFVTDSAAVSTVVAVVAIWGIAYVASQLARRPDVGLAGFVGAIAVVTATPGAVAVATWSVAAAGLYWLAVLWIAARIIDSRLPRLGMVYRLTAQLGLVVVALDGFTLAAVLAVVATGFHELEYRERLAGGHRSLAAATALLAWLFANAALHVDVIDLYVLPPLWLLCFALARFGAGRRVVIPLAVACTVAFTVIGRLYDGRAIHTLILGVSALAVAGWGEAKGQRSALAIGGAVAVATAAFEGLDQSMGIETWGWLVVGGIAAITAAGLLEIKEQSERTAEDSAGANGLRVS